MTLDIVTKGIPFFHMAIVTVMVLAGVPRIFSYTALIWGVCSYMSIPLTEEGFYLEIPALWRYRPLFGLGVCYMVFTEWSAFMINHIIYRLKDDNRSL